MASAATDAENIRNIIDLGPEYYNMIIKDWTNLIPTLHKSQKDKHIKLLNLLQFHVQYNEIIDETNDISVIDTLDSSDIELTIKYTEKAAIYNDTTKCVICLEPYYQNENSKIIRFPCGNCNNHIHVECFRMTASINSNCPTCHLNTKLYLYPIVDCIVTNLISESKNSDIYTSKEILEEIQIIIDDLIENKILNIDSFLEKQKVTSIVSWKDIFMIAGCKYTLDKLNLYLPDDDSKKKAKYFNYIITKKILI